LSCGIRANTGSAELGACALPGSEGEHQLQRAYGKAATARKFYQHQMLDYLNPIMREFIARQEMMFVGTADKRGHADATSVCILAKDTLTGLRSSNRWPRLSG
jgi:hypothetical protein